MAPIVSVIIPTRNRPGPLLAAVASALEQRLDAPDTLEVIVIQDGPDISTENALRSIRDARLKLSVNTTQRGHATSRNAGVSLASGDWCAFLDDDDTWLPGKLGHQLRAARHAVAQGTTYPVVGCVLEAREKARSHIWPSRFPVEHESVGDYLYARSGLQSVRSGHTLLQTSMLFVPKSLMDLVPFSGGMRRHADPDWLLRAQQQPGVRFCFPEPQSPLAVWNIGGVDRVSGAGDWRYSLVWARRHRALLSESAYAGFLSGPAAHIASSIPDTRKRRLAFRVLMREMFTEGSPSLWDLLALGVKYFARTRIRRRSAHPPGQSR